MPSASTNAKAPPNGQPPASDEKGSWWERLALKLSLASRGPKPSEKEGARSTNGTARGGLRTGGPNSGAPEGAARLKHPGDLSPFLDARQIATDHFARLNRKARRYMLLAALLAVAVVILAGGLVALALSSDVIAFEVRTDGETGQILRASRVEPLSGDVDGLLVRAKLKAFVRGLRTVYADRRATLERLRSSYALVAKGSGASAFLADFYERTGEYPLDEVGRLQRSVEEITLNKVAGTDTWRLRWREREVGRQGAPRERVFEGSLSLRQREETGDVKRTEENILGVHVVGLSFRPISQELLGPAASAPAAPDGARGAPGAPPSPPDSVQ